MSLHGRGLSVHAMKRMLINTDHDPELDPSDYEDVKMELRSTSHNLVSIFASMGIRLDFS
jgi:hypothetical protein